MLKIRRPLGRLIFNMGIAIPGKTVFLIETAPWAQPHVIGKPATQASGYDTVMCVGTIKGQVSSQYLQERMQLDDLMKVLCTRRLKWHGHVTDEMLDEESPKIEFLRRSSPPSS